MCCCYSAVVSVVGVRYIDVSVVDVKGVGVSVVVITLDIILNVIPLAILSGS